LHEKKFQVCWGYTFWISYQRKLNQISLTVFFKTD
jgi:hypothetical protein